MPIMKKSQALSALQFSLSTKEFNADMFEHLVMVLGQAGYPLITVPDDHQILIETDQYYEPDGDYDLEEEREKLASGEWGVYTVSLQRECQCGNWIHVTSLAGVVVEGSWHDNAYGTLDGICDEYLRHTAAELILEAQNA